jgi:hypothetical protein
MRKNYKKVSSKKEKNTQAKKPWVLSIYHVAILYMILWLSKHAYKMW